MIEIIPTKVIHKNLIKRLCRVLTKEEKNELGYVQIKVVPKGKTGIKPIRYKVSLADDKTKPEGNIAVISFFQIYNFGRSFKINPFHDFNEAFARYLYWCFGAILMGEKDISEFDHYLLIKESEVDFIRRAKQKRLLDFYDYKEYGLFSIKRRHIIDRAMQGVREGNFKSNMPIIHHLRKLKLGKNYKYSLPELYYNLFGNSPYTFEQINTELVIKRTKNEYVKFKNKLASKLPSAVYKTKKGKKFLYFDDKALKKAYQILIKNFGLFKELNHITIYGDIYTEDGSVLKTDEEKREHELQSDYQRLKERYYNEGFTKERLE